MATAAHAPLVILRSYCPFHDITRPLPMPLSWYYEATAPFVILRGHCACPSRDIATVLSLAHGNCPSRDITTVWALFLPNPRMILWLGYFEVVVMFTAATSSLLPLENLFMWCSDVYLTVKFLCQRDTILVFVLAGPRLLREVLQKCQMWTSCHDNGKAGGIS